MGRLIDADKLKQHYAWWNNEEKELFDSIVDAQPTVYNVEKVDKQIDNLFNMVITEVYKSVDGRIARNTFADVLKIMNKMAKDIIFDGGKE